MLGNQSRRVGATLLYLFLASGNDVNVNLVSQPN